MFKNVFRTGICTIVTAVCVASGALTSDIHAFGPGTETPSSYEPVISILRPDGAEGRGYQLVYTINAPLDVAWNFKTDFESQVLLTNKMIHSHRLVSRNANQVITETVYSNKPGVVFKWKTTLFPQQRQLKFELLNPDECGVKYHYGSIQLASAGSTTRITQVAYFDFFGVSLWVSYPFRGGMSHFLKYTVRWEQQAVRNYWHPEAR